MAFDTSKSKLAKSNFAVGYTTGDFTLHTSVWVALSMSPMQPREPNSSSSLPVCTCSNDGSDFTGSVFQKVNNQLEAGVQLNWTAGSNATKFGLAAKYTPDKDSTIRVSALLPSIDSSIL